VRLFDQLAERSADHDVGRILGNTEDLVRIAIGLGSTAITSGPDSSPGGRRAVSNSESAVVTPHRSARRFRRAYNAMQREFSSCVSQRSHAIA